MNKYSYRGKEFTDIVEYAKYVVECDKQDKLKAEKENKLKEQKESRIAEVKAAEKEYIETRNKAYNDYIEIWNRAKRKYDGIVKGYNNDYNVNYTDLQDFLDYFKL